ncbi:hypothetical protein ACM66B_006621 [Microbotryomycetes sp. NB124-2]
MASGFGYEGGRSRCFPFWQDFQKCYASADVPTQCVAQKEDYLECLHHTKEISRAMQIKAQYLKKTAHEVEEKKKQTNTAADSGILGLGLLSSGSDSDAGSSKE